MVWEKYKEGGIGKIFRNLWDGWKRKKIYGEIYGGKN